jgi:hypothetical protein
MSGLAVRIRVIQTSSKRCSSVYHMTASHAYGKYSGLQGRQASTAPCMRHHVLQHLRKLPVLIRPGGGHRHEPDAQMWVVQGLDEDTAAFFIVPTRLCVASPRGPEHAMPPSGYPSSE